MHYVFIEIWSVIIYNRFIDLTHQIEERYQTEVDERKHDLI